MSLSSTSSASPSLEIGAVEDVAVRVDGQWPVGKADVGRLRADGHRVSRAQEGAAAQGSGPEPRHSLFEHPAAVDREALVVRHRLPSRGRRALSDHLYGGVALRSSSRLSKQAASRAGMRR